MNKLNNLVEALTFDDVLLVPRYSNLMSRSEDTDVSTQLGNLDFAIPVLPANMDTICEEDMSLKMDELGGLGLIHRRMTLSRTQEIIDKHKVRNLGLSVGSIHAGKDLIDLAIKHAAVICIDIAHGDSVHMFDTLNYIRNKCKYKGTIIAGN
jgi:IMP dehydrogenase